MQIQYRNVLFNLFFTLIKITYICVEWLFRLLDKKLNEFTQSNICDHLLSALYTSVLMTRGLFPRLSKKCRGDSIVPNSWRSPNLSLSVSVVAEIPASGPRLGREPAVTEGSGICPGIVSDSVVTTARRQREKTDQWKTHTTLLYVLWYIHMDTF